MPQKMIRCPEGHFFDPVKHGSCPWCARAQPSPAAPNPGRTMGVGAETKPVVGWLVCVAGPDRGRDFRLHAEKNYIGRSPAMDVVIMNDNSVSRDKHGILVFDPRRKNFWALPGEASGLVYLNGEVVYSPTQMNPDDLLELGQTKLVLVPFCGEKFAWGEAVSA